MCPDAPVTARIIPADAARPHPTQNKETYRGCVRESQSRDATWFATRGGKQRGRDIDGLRREIDVRQSLEGIRSSIRFMVGAMITVSASILGLLVQMNLNITQLQP
ncbi:MAG: hypothetical protein RLZZ305_1218 [Actinomycetota bacterium]|jgi:hypothetical protein